MMNRKFKEEKNAQISKIAFAREATLEERKFNWIKKNPDAKFRKLISGKIELEKKVKLHIQKS